MPRQVSTLCEICKNAMKCFDIEGYYCGVDHEQKTEKISDCEDLALEPIEE